MDLLVRDLDPALVERLKQRARRHGRSLQSEAKTILDAAATLTMEEASQLDLLPENRATLCESPRLDWPQAGGPS